MSQLFAPTLREDPKEAEVVSHKLMLRAGYIRKVASGIYEYLPLGWKVIQKVSQIIREEMNKAGAQELFMPAILPSELWKETGRWDVYGKELLRIKDRHEREFCFGPTHEEIITDLARREIKSYKQLPINLYQIQTKFRDEVRPRFGLMRGREFLMKDSYSFDLDEKSMQKTYQKMYETYCRIFDRFGLKYKVAEADSGEIGGNFSQEFMVLADSGEDEMCYCAECCFASISGAKTCPHCKVELKKCRGIEVGQIFQLGTKYSEKMKAMYLDENNQEKPLVMGCYGIGVSRTAAAAIEQNNDKDGIIWPLAIAPYQVAIVPADINNEEQADVAGAIYCALLEKGIDVLLDDRDARMGIKLKDIDLMGIPMKIIIGRALADGQVELKMRRSTTGKLFSISEISHEIQRQISSDNPS